MSGERPLPRISLVTPSFNHAGFVGRTIESVLSQRYPDLEYVVMDGGSTDGSLEIIKSYADDLHAWRSGKDDGQYAAIAEGFAETSGEVLGWLNSDDIHCPWVLKTVGTIMRDIPDCMWLTTCNKVLFDSHEIPHLTRIKGYSRKSFMEGRHMLGAEGNWGGIQQESTFWRRGLWDRVGGFDPAFRLAGDFALWVSFYQHAELMCTVAPLGGPRVHRDQLHLRQKEPYIAEARQALEAMCDRPKPGLSNTLAGFRRQNVSRVSVARDLAESGAPYVGLRIRRGWFDEDHWEVERFSFA